MIGNFKCVLNFNAINIREMYSALLLYTCMKYVYIPYDEAIHQRNFKLLMLTHHQWLVNSYVYTHPGMYLLL